MESRADRPYLNAASWAPIPERSSRATERFNRRRQRADQIGPEDFSQIYADARAYAARLVGGKPAEIALGPNTSFGLNLAASITARRHAGGGHNPERRRTVVISDREFPANVYPWLALEREGMKTELVAADSAGRPREDALLQRIDSDDVAVCSVSAVHFASGFRIDLEAVGRVCAERDILFVVDAIQGLGIRPIDVEAARIDVLSSGGQKWLCSPFGSGFCYIRDSLCRAWEAPFPGWLSVTASQEFDSLLDYDLEPLPDARRFEVGSLAAQDFLGFSRSVELLLELGVERIGTHVFDVQRPLIDWVAARDDVTMLSDVTESRRSGIVSFRPPDAESARDALAEAGAVVAMREGAVRIAPHFYNTVREMEYVVEVLDRVC